MTEENVLLNGSTDFPFVCWLRRKWKPLSFFSMFTLQRVFNIVLCNFLLWNFLWSYCSSMVQNLNILNSCFPYFFQKIVTIDGRILTESNVSFFPPYLACVCVCVCTIHIGYGSWHSSYIIMTKEDQFSFSLISESEVKTLSFDCLAGFFFFFNFAYVLLVFRIIGECFYNPVISDGKNNMDKYSFEWLRTPYYT